MTSEPFTSHDSGYSDASGDSSQYQSTPHAHEPHYFDRPGLAWILACVLFATAAAHWVPHLAEPAGIRRVLVSMGWNSAAPEQAGSLPQEAVNTARVALQPPAQERFSTSVFRQY
jgi:hypothetical protein